ncbi:MAG: glycosyl hydrolase [Planctomycetota bacterium]
MKNVGRTAFCIVVTLISMAAATPKEAAVHVKREQWGVSTRYIGANEGGARFDPADLKDCGINTFRIYATLWRYEPEDDGGAYGSPSIEEIKANPDIVPWDRWDANMELPLLANPALGFTKREVFDALKAQGIKTVLSLRNIHDYPTWIAAVPRTEDDWTEWWEHVFALAYWLNVRNDYGVDDYEVFNEPNVADQGWTGTQQEYFELVRRTKDAIDHVYRTYLPERTYHVHAPVTAGGDWTGLTLRQVGDHFDSLNVHTYDWNMEGFIRRMHWHLGKAGRADYPLWISEWGTYQHSYDNMDLSLSVIANLIRGSRPGRDYVYGSHIFSMYEWGDSMDGLVRSDGSRSNSYYAMRMAVRALQGGRPTFETTSDSADLLGITTKARDGKVHLLVVNSSRQTPYRVRAELPGLLASGTGVVRHFSAEKRDEIVGQTDVVEGNSAFDIPPAAAVLVSYEPAP